ncbi:hypothetical protein HMPREF1578_00784, partial [Gardnerella pickettii JCP8017B]
MTAQEATNKPNTIETKDARVTPEASAPLFGSTPEERVPAVRDLAEPLLFAR